MPEKCKIGSKAVKDLKDHTDNISYKNENSTFTFFEVPEKIKEVWNRGKARLLNAPDERKDGDRFIRDIVRETMKGTEAERAEIIIKWMALISANELLSAKLKDFYYLEISRLSKQFFLSKKEKGRIISADMNIVLKNIPLPMLKVLYGETVAFVHSKDSILNPFSNKKKGYIKGWIGNVVLRIGTPFRNKYRDITGGMIVMTEASMNYVSEVAKNIVRYMQPDIFKQKSRNYGFDDIFTGIKALADLQPNLSNGHLTVVRLFSLYNRAQAFIGKDGKFYVFTKRTPRMKDNGEMMYYKKSGDVMFDYSEPVPAAEYWQDKFPMEEMIDFTPGMLVKFRNYVKQFKTVYAEVFDDHLILSKRQEKELLVELSKFFPPNLDKKTLAKILFTDEGMQTLDPEMRDEIQFLKDTFMQYAIFEPFLDQGHVPDPARKQDKYAMAIKYHDTSFMLGWAVEIARLESEVRVAVAGGNKKKIGIAEANLNYYNNQFDRMIGAPTDSQTGTKVMPRSTAMFMKRVTNSFSHVDARTDESVIYDYLKTMSSTLARNDLIISMLRSWRMAKGNKLVQSEILETWKTTMHMPGTMATGVFGVEYGTEHFTRMVNKVGIGRFKLNISSKFVDRLFRSASNYVTGAKLGGRISPVKNATAMLQKVFMFGMDEVRDVVRNYHQHQKMWDKMISLSGALSYGDFFSKGLVSNLSGDHELDRENTWKVIQIYFQYYKEHKMALRKKAGMTEAKAVANLHERLMEPLSHMPSEQNLKGMRSEIRQQRLVEMTAKWANRAITLEYRNLKHIDSIPDALIWKVQNMAQFSNEFQLHAAQMPTMGKTEGFLRSTSFVMGVLKLQQMGHIRSSIDELTGQQLSDAIRFGRIYTEYIDFALSQQGVGRANRGPIGSFLNRFKFWPQQKFGWDVRMYKYAYQSLKSVEHLSNQTFDIKAVLKMLKVLGSNFYSSAKLKTLMADNPHAAAFIKFTRLIVPITFLLDFMFAGPVLSKVAKKFLPGYRENKGMYSLGQGISSDLVSLVMVWPWIIGMSFNNADADDWDEYLEQIIRNLWVGAGGMAGWNIGQLVYYIISQQEEKSKAMREQLMDTAGWWPGGRIKNYKAWYENASKALKE